MELLGSHVGSKATRVRNAKLQAYDRVTDNIIYKRVEPWTPEQIEARRNEIMAEYRAEALESRYRMELSGEHFARDGGEISYLPSQDAVIEALAEFVGRGAVRLVRGVDWDSPNQTDDTPAKAAQKLARTMATKGYGVSASTKLSQGKYAVVEVTRLPSADGAPTLQAATG